MSNWEIRRSKTPHGSLIKVYTTNNNHVCSIGFEGKPKREANARLIAAAPEMYEALECIANGKAIDLIAGDSEVTGIAIMIRNALAKVRGEGWDTLAFTLGSKETEHT